MGKIATETFEKKKKKIRNCCLNFTEKNKFCILISIKISHNGML